MNTSAMNLNDRYSLLRIGEAWRNRPGLTTMLITFVVVALLLALGTNGGVGTFAVAAALGVLTVFAGFSAAGIQFMDQAAGRLVTPITAALIGSPMVLLRSLGLALLLGVIFLAYLATAAIVLLVCKVPALGPLIYMIAVPVLTFAGALVILGLTVAGLIAGTALWEGQPIGAALALGWAVATQRPMQGFLSIMMLFIATSLVALVVSAFVFAGFGVVAGLSAAILGSHLSGGLQGFMGSMMAGGLGSGSAGIMAVAALIGGALVFALVQALFAAMFALGLALTYLKITEGVDTATAKSAINSAIAKTTQKAQFAASEARRVAQEAQANAQKRAEQARNLQAARDEPSAAPALACPKCAAAISAGESFCGGCGFKLV